MKELNNSLICFLSIAKLEPKKPLSGKFPPFQKKMSSLELLKDVYYVGYVDWEVRNFHGYSTHKGSSYNAYIAKSGEKTILIDINSSLLLGEVSNV